MLRDDADILPPRESPPMRRHTCEIANPPQRARLQALAGGDGPAHRRCKKSQHTPRQDHQPLHHHSCQGRGKVK